MTEKEKKGSESSSSQPLSDDDVTFHARDLVLNFKFKQPPTKRYGMSTEANSRDLVWARENYIDWGRKVLRKSKIGS